MKLGLGRIRRREQRLGFWSRQKRPADFETQGEDGLLIFYDLRRSAVRNLVRAGVPEKIAMKVSGHLTREVFERYNISSEKDVLDAGKKLAKFHDEKVGDNSGTAMRQEDAAASSAVQ